MKEIRILCLLFAGIFLLRLGVGPVSASLTRINPGGSVFIGEEGLDISGAVGSASQIAWWPSAGMVTISAPAKVVDVSGSKSAFLVSPPSFVGYNGPWYAYDGSTPSSAPSPVLVVQDPQMDIRVWDLDLNTDVTGMSVEQGERLTFRIDSNLNAASNPSSRPDVNPSTDGFVDIRVKTEDGATLGSLWESGTVSRSLTSQFVNTGSYYWGGSAGSNVWGTGATDSGGKLRYPAGVYAVYAVSTLNNMRTNYKNAGADYTGKTITQTQVVNIVSPSLKLEANKDSVIRGTPFSVTVTGKPGASFYVWVSGTGGMTGNPLDRPPVISRSQDGVAMDPENGPFAIGSYVTSGGSALRNDVPPSVSGVPSTGYYARVTTTTRGIRTVQFETAPETKPVSYTIRVEGSGLSDTAPVRVDKGTVTITASGSQKYNRGDVIHFSGTNAETGKTYLFLGNSLSGGKLSNPPAAVTNYDATTFDSANVLGDGSWSYDWSTNGLNLPNGTCTVYAVTGPYGKTLLGDATSGSVTIAINSSIAATTSQTTTTTTTTTANVTGTATTSATTTTTRPTTTASTSVATTHPTISTMPSSTVSPAKTSHKPTTRITTGSPATPSQDTPLPCGIACLSLVICAGIVLHRKK